MQAIFCRNTLFKQVNLIFKGMRYITSIFFLCILTRNIGYLLQINAATAARDSSGAVR